MKRLMTLLLYIIVLLLVNSAWAKLRLITQQRQTDLILGKYAISDKAAVNSIVEANVKADTKINDTDNGNVDYKFTDRVNVNANDNVAAAFDAKVHDNYKVTGVLEIPKIGLKCPILDKTTEEALKLSITAYAGKINEIGNFVISGHNYRNGFGFGKLKKIELNDTIIINNTIFKVFDIFVVKPVEVERVVCQHTNGERWVTLFTCTNGGKDRLIVRARAI